MSVIKIPDAVIRRLPKYYRYLKELSDSGEDRISSATMSEDLALNASQIRRDLNYFGGFGQQGYGYQVKKLKSELEKILGVNKTYRAVIVGAGNIGQALSNYSGFISEGVVIEALFDVKEELCGSTVNGAPILPARELSAYVRDNGIDIGIITTPKEAAAVAARELSEAGVSGIWNFAPTDISLEDGRPVENVHLSDSLSILRFLINNSADDAKDV